MAQFTVKVPDEQAEALETFSDERICAEIVEVLEELAAVDEKRDELRERVGIPSSDSEDGEGEEVAPDEQMRRKLKELRRSGANR